MFCPKGDSQGAARKRGNGIHAGLWLAVTVVPIVAFFAFPSEDNHFTAAALSALGGTILAASTVWGATDPDDRWGRVLWRAALAMGISFALLCACLLLFDPRGSVYAIGIAGSWLIPSIFVAPYLTLRTRKPFAAIVFTNFLIIAMKLIGCFLVACVYGWDADEHGYMTMPFASPNLLVWTFWFLCILLSAACGWLGRREFRRASACHTPV